jgi:NADPH:quinone reductase-like Zn-dependent oxidoreductase
MPKFVRIHEGNGLDGLHLDDLPLPGLELTARNASLRPYSMMNFTAKPECRERGVKFVHDAVKRGDLQPRVDRSFSLQAFRDAFEYIRSKRSGHGKVVIETGREDLK